MTQKKFKEIIHGREEFSGESLSHISVQENHAQCNGCKQQIEFRNKDKATYEVAADMWISDHIWCGEEEDEPDIDDEIQSTFEPGGSSNPYQ